MKKYAQKIKCPQNNNIKVRREVVGLSFCNKKTTKVESCIFHIQMLYSSISELHNSGKEGEIQANGRNGMKRKLEKMLLGNSMYETTHLRKTESDIY